jgi:cell division cycle 14
MVLQPSHTDAQICLAQIIEAQDLTHLSSQFEVLFLQQNVGYDNIVDDFGQIDLSKMVDFIKRVDRALSSSPNKKILVFAGTELRNLTNAAFLLGSYMIIKLRQNPDEVKACCTSITLFEPHMIDASSSPVCFSLQLIDCWRGLDRARRLGWVRYGGEGHMWGAVDVDEHRHYARPDNGGIIAVVPGRVFIIGTTQEEGDSESNSVEGGSEFNSSMDAEAMANALLDLGVTTLVQLGGPPPTDDAAALSARSIRLEPLPLDLSLPTPADTAARFLSIADAAAPGSAVALRCHGSRRARDAAGELAARHLMGEWGFGAREALGWLRVARPGSVGEEAARRLVCDAESDAGCR